MSGRNGNRRLTSRLDELERLLHAELAQPALADPYAGMSEEERLERTIAVLRILTPRGRPTPEATLNTLEPLFDEAEAAG